MEATSDSNIIIWPQSETITFQDVVDRALELNKPIHINSPCVVELDHNILIKSNSSKLVIKSTVNVVNNSDNDVWPVVIISNCHSIFQVEGRHTVLLIENLMLHHVYYQSQPKYIGAAVFGLNLSNISVISCRIVSDYGFGIWSVQRSSIQIDRSFITSVRRSGCVAFGQSKLTITNSEISNCQIHNICSRGNTTISLKNCILKNACKRSIYAYHSVHLTLDECKVTGTQSSDTGAIEVYFTKPLTGDTFAKRHPTYKSKDEYEPKVMNYNNNTSLTRLTHQQSASSSKDSPASTHMNPYVNGQGKKKYKALPIAFSITNSTISCNAGVGILLKVDSTFLATSSDDFSTKKATNGHVTGAGAIDTCRDIIATGPIQYAASQLPVTAATVTFNGSESSTNEPPNNAHSPNKLLDEFAVVNVRSIDIKKYIDYRIDNCIFENNMLGDFKTIIIDNNSSSSSSSSQKTVNDMHSEDEEAMSNSQLSHNSSNHNHNNSNNNGSSNTCDNEQSNGSDLLQQETAFPQVAVTQTHCWSFEIDDSSSSSSSQTGRGHSFVKQPSIVNDNHNGNMTSACEENVYWQSYTTDQSLFIELRYQQYLLSRRNQMSSAIFDGSSSSNSDSSSSNSGSSSSSGLHGVNIRDADHNQETQSGFDIDDASHEAAVQKQEQVKLLALEECCDERRDYSKCFVPKQFSNAGAAFDNEINDDQAEDSPIDNAEHNGASTTTIIDNSNNTNTAATTNSIVAFSINTGIDTTTTTIIPDTNNSKRSCCSLLTKLRNTSLCDCDYDYEIDFTEMTQTNISTFFARRIRRVELSTKRNVNTQLINNQYR